MPSTYSDNVGLELIANGEKTGTWGDTTNTNWRLVDQALGGQVTVTVPSTGATNSPNILSITNGAESDGRNLWIEIDDEGDLGGTAYVQIQPNDAQRIIYIRNALVTRDVLVFQGNYDSDRAVTVPNGKTVLVRFNGEGSTATASYLMSDLYILGTLQVFNTLQAGNLIISSNQIQPDSDAADPDLYLFPASGGDIHLFPVSGSTRITNILLDSALPVAQGGTGQTSEEGFRTAFEIIDEDDVLAWSAGHSYGTKALSVSASAATLDWEVGNFFFMPLSGDVALSDTNSPSGAVAYIHVLSSGSNTISNASWHWESGTGITLADGNHILRVLIVTGSEPLVTLEGSW